MTSERIQRRNRLLSRGAFLGVTVLLFLMVFSFGISAAAVNGTATGNILNGGYAVEGEDFSAWIDLDNNCALTVQTGNETYIADSDNAHYLNAVGSLIYYTSVNGDAEITELRCYDVATGDLTTLLSVPIDKGIKEVYVLDDAILFVSDCAICRLASNSQTAEKLYGSNIRDFVPVDNGYLYTLEGSPELFYYDFSTAASRLLAQNAIYFDYGDGNVYYSDGKSGVYCLPLDGGSAEKIADGGKNIVYSDDLYYKDDSEFYSLEGGSEASGDESEGAVFTVLGDEIDVTEELILSEDEEMAPATTAATLSTATTSAATPSATTRKLPDGDYKNWKQSDPRWGGNALGSSTIARSGCLVTSVSILLVGSGAKKDAYKNGSFDPGVFVRELSANGGLTSGGGVIWGGLTNYLGKKGSGFQFLSDTRSSGSDFGSASQSSQASSLAGHIEKNHFITVCVHNPSTGNTHWVAVDYVNGSDVIVCDPGYRSKSGHLYTDYPGRATRAVIFNYSGTIWQGDDVYVATPKITATSVANGEKVTISCATSGATIYYTTDGTTPTKNSKKYTGPFTISETKTIKAIAYANGKPSIVSAITIGVWIKCPFTDLSKTKWYYEDIHKVYDMKIFAGISDNKFAPDANMTRAQFANVMARILLGGGGDQYDNMTDIEFSEYIGAVPFVDVDDGQWYAERVYWAAVNGIMVGNDNSFRPYAPIQRQEICAVLVRFARDYLKLDLKATEPAVTFKDSNKIERWAKTDFAVAQRAGLIYGKSGNLADPTGTATRAEVAAMILRLVEKM